MEYYLPALVMLWENAVLDGLKAPLPEIIVVGGGCAGVGFIPVFESVEELRKHYPDASVITVKKAVLG